MGKTLSLLLAPAPLISRDEPLPLLNLAAVTSESTDSLVAARPQTEMTSGAHSSKLCALFSSTKSLVDTKKQQRPAIKHGNQCDGFWRDRPWISVAALSTKL